MPTDMDYEDDDDYGETLLDGIPQNMVGYVIGQGGRNIQKLMDETDTYITKRVVDDKTYFIIKGKAGNRRQAKLKIENKVEMVSAGETWLYIPQHLVGHAIGRGGKTKNKIMEDTNTYITITETVDHETYIVIQGKSENRFKAKLKLKRQARMGQVKLRGLKMTFFSCVDAQEGTFVLQPIENNLKNGDHFKLVLKSSRNEDSVGTGHFNLLFQELPNILREYESENRVLNVWCHLGNIHIKDCPDVQGKEYTLSEVESHVVPKRYLSLPVEAKWTLEFCSGLNATDLKRSVLEEWLFPKEEACRHYRRHEMTFLTPSCVELRLKVFVVNEQTNSQERQIIYHSSKCPHEIRDVIKSSDSPPYFYICESNPKRALVDIFEPSAQVDIRLIAEGNFNLPSNMEDKQSQEALILYDYVEKNLKITEQGEMIWSQGFPDDFDVRYSRVSERSSYRVKSPDGKQFTARISHESQDDVQGVQESGDLDIHLLIDNCSSMTPKEIIEEVPHLLNCARTLARKFENVSHQNIVPPEILARGPRAESAYQSALKSGKVKNCRVPIVVVGQSRSGKTSLLRSLHREKFNPSEDSTIGAKLQRSLSKAEDADWEKNEIDENVVYNRCAARAMMPHLLKADSMDSDDDYHDDYELYNENFIPEENIVNDSLETYQEEDKALPLKEDLKMANEQTTEKDFTKSITGEVHPKQLPEQVASFAKDILENPDSAKQMENDLFLHTMDFAGQPVYSVTHPMFLPPKGIFLLVHNLENDLHAKATPLVKCGAAERIIDDHCPMTNMDHLEFWLSLVAANSTREGGSLVFVVSTHADGPFQPDVKQTARQILKTLKREDFVPGRHVMLDIYTVDNTVSGRGDREDPAVLCLKADISNVARSLPQLNEDIPIRWLLFEDRLASLVSEKKKKYISHKDAITIAIECEVDVVSIELNTLLDYLHDLKVIICFPEIDSIFIDTKWLLDIFAKVITVLPIENHKGYEDEWRKLEHQGIVDEEFLKYLWRDLIDDNTPIQSIITLMEKFSLICRQLDGSHLVPAMLLNDPECHELMEKDDKASPLVIRFNSSHLPFGVFPRLFVAVHEMCISKWPDSTPPALSKNFSRFYIVEDTLSLILKSDVQTITVALVNEETPDSQRDSFVQLCAFLLDFLREVLPKMMQSFPWMKRLEFEFGIHCPICEGAAPCTKHNKMACSKDSCAHFVSEKELLKKVKPRCHKNFTKFRNIIPASSFSHWFQRKVNSAEVKEIQEQLQGLCLGSDKDVCKEVVAAVNQISKNTSSEEKTRLAKEIADKLGLDKHSTATPPQKIIQKFRTNCRWVIAQGGEDFVEALRKELPNGMTGPLRVGYDVKVRDMDTVSKTQFSQALTANEMEWKAFAKEKVGLSQDQIEFLDKREKNPVLEILNENCRDWSAEQLYDAVAGVGADAIADRYL